MGDGCVGSVNHSKLFLSLKSFSPSGFANWYLSKLVPLFLSAWERFSFLNDFFLAVHKIAFTVEHFIQGKLNLSPLGVVIHI